MDITIRTRSIRGLTKGVIRHLSIHFLICLTIVFTVLTIGCIEDGISKNVSDFPEREQNSSGTSITENIEKTLVGHQIVYYDIAGEPRYYNISKSDILSIEKSESDGEVVWIATVGSGMQWEICLNSTGESILKEIQLFRT